MPDLIGALAKSAGTEVVVFVHGTGSADPADKGDRWWQTGSSFEQAFSKAIGSGIEVSKPFHWSGANSETERRAGGLRLLEQLYAFDAQKISYHLIGHSHGGSLIWHALTASAERGQKLFGLRSWATVGTPFLKFLPIFPSTWRWLAFLCLLIMMGWLVSADRLSEWLPAIRQILHVHGYLPLAGMGAIFATILLIIFLSLLRILRPIFLIIAERSRRTAESRAKDWYGDLWLGLWHPFDEPINALAGTVGETPQIAPRLAAERLFSFLPIIGPAVRDILRNAADEFAWKQITDRAQGNDRTGYRLVNAGRAPLVLVGGLINLPSALADELANSADTNSIDAVRRLRVLLQAAYDQQESRVVLENVATVVSFQEIIHTSYFANTGIVDKLAVHVGQSSSTATKVNSASSPNASVKTEQFSHEAEGRHVSLAPLSSNPRKGLEIVSAIGLLIGPGTLLILVAASLYQTIVSPLTNHYQIERIAAAMQDPARTSVGDSSIVGEVIAGLGSLGYAADPVDLLSRIPANDSRTAGAIPLAQWLGQQGRWSDLASLAQVPTSNIRGNNLEVSSVKLRAVAITAASKKSMVPPVQFMDRFESDLLRSYGYYAGPEPLLEIDDEGLGRAMARFSQFERIKRIVGTPNDYVPGREIEPYQYPQFSRCRFLAGATLGAIDIGEDADLLSSGCDESVPPTGFFYKKASAYLDRRSERLDDKITKVELAKHTYRSFNDQFDTVIAAYKEDLEFPPHFLDDNKYRMLIEKVRQIGVDLDIHRRLELRLTGADSFAEFAKGLTKSANRFRGQNLTLQVKYPIIVLLKCGLEQYNSTSLETTRAALAELYRNIFSDITSAPEPYGSNQAQTGMNMFAEASELLRMTGDVRQGENLFEEVFKALQKSKERSYIKAEGFISLAEAIDHFISGHTPGVSVNLVQLREQALSETLSTMRDDGKRYAFEDIAVRFVRILNDNSDARTSSAISKAELAVEMESTDERRSKLLLELSRVLIQRRELAFARTIAEKAPSRSVTMTAYRDILAHLIAMRM